MIDTNKQWLFVKRPDPHADSSCFRLLETPLEPLADGHIRVRLHYLSVDPYMRGRLDDVRSYAPPQPLGQVMEGGGVGEVVESRHPRFKVGDKVLGHFGWQKIADSDGRGIRRVDDSVISLSAYLSAVGMPGVTAWYGINKVIEPREGETIVVSAASGAVGSVAGQLAKAKGCRVVGIAGGPDKCRMVTEGFLLDDCIDYRAPDFAERLRAATPNRIDGLFENVGGRILDQSLGRMNAFGRIAVCGLISGYSGESIPINNFRSILINRLKVQGFIISEQPGIWAEALAELAEGVATQRIRYHESIAEGIESTPEAFFGLLSGRNIGKQIVRVISDGSI
jgi:NADPH-dependent curcumin reductase CurA